MNKTVLVLAIFAFCLPLSVLSSDLKENDNRELVSIDLTGLLGGLLANSTRNSTNTTVPAVNNTSSANNTAPAANNTVPAANNTSGANNTAPAANNTSSANTTAPATNSTSSNNTSSASANNTNSTNSTQPADSDSESDADPISPTNTTNTTNATNSTNTTVTPAPIKYYKNDVNMTTFKDDCIRVHNDYRNQVNLSNLTWSDSLAASAQAWADNMAVNGFRHSGKTGENIASTSYTTSVLGRLLGLWVHEKSHFIVGCKYPACSSTSAEVGHYTQIVWHSTTQVGCGFAPGANRGYNYLCCQYYKAGNVIGQYVY